MALLALVLSLAVFAAVPAAAAPSPCQWAYYPGGTGNPVSLRADDDTIAPTSLVVGHWSSPKNPTAAQRGVFDFDGDGRTDVFQVTVNGGFDQWRYAPGGTGPWVDIAYGGGLLDPLLFGDFNGDGRTDVLYVNGLTWLISYGGNTTYTQVNSFATSPRPVATGDFDGDGRADVLTATSSFATGGVRWEYSSAASQPLVLLAEHAADPGTVRLGDFDGDGKTDVLTATDEGDGAHQWAYWSGGRPPRIDLARTPYPPGQVIIGDFDGDAVSDVFVPVDPVGGTPRWEYWPRGLSNPVVLHEGEARVPFLADFDGNGVTDAFLTTCTTRPAFRSWPLVRLQVQEAASEYFLEPLDIDGDGRTDLAWYSNCQQIDPTVGLCGSYANVVTGALTRSDTRTFAPLVNQLLDSAEDWSYYRVFPGDVDGDGRGDLLLNDPFPGDNLVAVVRSTGAGFALTKVGALPMGGLAPSGGVSDVDGDGRTDLVWSSRCFRADGMTPFVCEGNDDNVVRIGFSTGTGYVLAAPQTIAADGWRIYDTFAGDVNGDGRGDLIWSSTCQELGLIDCIGADANVVRVGFSNGAGGFDVTPPQTLDGAGWKDPRAILTGDFNGDRHTDLLWYYSCPSPIECDAENRLRVALSSPDGTFLLAPEQTFGRRDWGNGWQLVRLDVNGDSWDDVLWSRRTVVNDVSVVAYLPAFSNGDGTFTLGKVEQVGGALPASPTLGRGDFDGDGRGDLVWAAGQAVKVVVAVSCTTVPECVQALDAVLPAPDAVSERPRRRLAKKLHRLARKVGAQLEKAADAEGRKRVRRTQKALTMLDRLLDRGREAATNGELPLLPVRLEAAVAALRELVPAPQGQ